MRNGGKPKKVVSPETGRKISAALKGRKLSAEHCRKISEAKRNPSKKTRKKMSEAFYKRKHPRLRPLGSENEKKGYVRVKIAQPNVWKYKHIYIWESINGPLPDGHIVIFADKDTRNFDPDNLIAVPRRVSMVMNKCKLVFPESEITKVGKSIAEIKILIRDRRLKRKAT
jgi:hypothetical protein